MMHFDTQSHPKQAYRNLALLLAALLIFPFAVAPFGDSWVRIADMALLYIMLAVGLNIVVGFAGLLDLGYIAFYALGAYLTGMLASPQFATFLESLINFSPAIGNALAAVMGEDIRSNGIHLSVWFIVPMAAALAGLFGVILGAPTLKLRGDYLAIVTLGFGEIIRVFLQNLIDPVNVTNGMQGINMIDPIKVFGVSLAGERGIVAVGGFSMPKVNAYYFLFLLLAIGTVFVTSRLQHSRLGRAWVAIREDEIAAKAMGINTRNVKLLAFSMGATFGGVAGAMYASFTGFVSPESFSLTESISVLAMVVLGGIGHVPGVVLGAVLLASLQDLLRYVVNPLQMKLFGEVLIDAEVLRQLLYGLALVLIMLVRPAGLWPSPKHEDRPDADSDAKGQSTGVMAA
ncbi:branched-chain amino acid ABC transporter permease [Pseudoduganella violaceinigra]|uniref:branched-chain amino acid ABC transporter permease n=1 Tax=Pseudoduganella violaceinigra TaxID=246602 RepID=UPI0004280BAA|nr:ABC transporter ATP-binding protein [Pseudoduganella violaceinigra]